MRKRSIMSVFIIFGLAFLIGALLILFSARHANNLARVRIVVAPGRAKLTINGKAAKSGENNAPLGTVEVNVSLSGFASQTQTLTLKKGDNTFVGFILVSNNSSTADWYAAHPDDQALATSVGSQQYDANSSQSASNVPLIKSLPYIGPGLEYRIDYGVNPSASTAASGTNPAIYINALAPRGRQDALAWIKGQGYDLSSMKFVFSEQVF